MERELDVLGNLEATDHPRVFLLGGTKITDSLHVADSVLDRGLADTVLVTGVIGNVFLFAKGVDLGSASEQVIRDRDSWDTVEWAANLLTQYDSAIEVPVDVAADIEGERRLFDFDQLPVPGPVLDIGPKTIDLYRAIIEDSATAIGNGPAGMFERPPFAQGTQALYQAITRAGFSVIGGGDTAAAIRQMEIEGFDHVSTGGGAAMQMLTGESLPAVEALRNAR